MTGIVPPQRGMLFRADNPSDVLNFHFNPTNMTVTKKPQYRMRPKRNDDKGPHQDYIGSMPSTLKVKLLFDAVSDFGLPRSVSSAIDTLKAWTRPTESSARVRKPQPATLKFFWGAASTDYFPPCRISSLKVQYTRFDMDGSPSRANVTVTLTEVADKLGPQNPTSGGIVGRRSVTVDAGDTLATVAFAEYGNPNMWRALAEANNIDDPLRLRPGVTLFVPSKPDAEKLVRGTDA